MNKIFIAILLLSSFDLFASDEFTLQYNNSSDGKLFIKYVLIKDNNNFTLVKSSEKGLVKSKKILNSIANNLNHDINTNIWELEYKMNSKKVSNCEVKVNIFNLESRTKVCLNEKIKLAKVIANMSLLNNVLDSK